MVFEVQNPQVYRALLAIALGSGVSLAVRQSQTVGGQYGGLVRGGRSAGDMGRLARLRARRNRDGFSSLRRLCHHGLALLEILPPLGLQGVLLTSLAFLAWGLVFPVAEICGALHINIPGDHVVWDLPKYFVAFGMIMTLFENQTEILQVEIAVRKRAEETAQAANEAKGILMASVSFAARRILSAAGWETVIPETLSKIGVAARVSRAYVAHVHPAERGLASTVLLHEWNEPGARPAGADLRKRTWPGPGRNGTRAPPVCAAAKSWRSMPRDVHAAPPGEPAPKSQSWCPSKWPEAGSASSDLKTTGGSASGAKPSEMASGPPRACWARR